MKKARILLTSALLVLVAATGYAQGGLANASPECIKFLNFLKTDMDQGNLKDAATNWRGAFLHCDPGVRQGIYTDGQRIFRYLIEKNKGNPEVRNALVDSLLMMFDLRIKYFPGNAASAAEFKVYELVEHKGEDDEKVLEAVEKAIELAGKRTHPAILVTAMQRVTNLYSNNKLPAEKVIEKYAKLTDIVDALIAANNAQADQAKRDIDNLFAVSGVASCDNIVELFTPRFKENPNDKALLSTIVRLLNDGDCTDERLFLESVQALHRLEPNFQSAYYLYRLFASNDDHQNAIKMLKEAIESDQSSDEQDANMLVELSTYYLQKLENLPLAAEAARQAIQKSSAVAGRANLLLGLVWGSLRCQGDEIESRAKFWVAVDYLIRARNADPSVAEEANRHIATYSQYFPEQADAFMNNVIDGEPYTVNCAGMRERTTVRTRK